MNTACVGGSASVLSTATSSQKSQNAFSLGSDTTRWGVSVGVDYIPTGIVIAPARHVRCALPRAKVEVWVLELPLA